MGNQNGDLVSLECESCGEDFEYRLTKSPFKKKFCEKCADLKNYENKRRFDERGRDINDTAEQARCRLALKNVPNRDINPHRIISNALRIAT